MITLPYGTELLMQEQAHRFATIVKVTRRDGTITRYTDHNEAINHNQIEYTPVGGFVSSASRKEIGLRERNQDLAGYIASSSLTFDDIRSRRYHGARLDFTVIDWRFPWMGDFHKDTLFITDVQADGEAWSVSCVGQTAKLSKKYGNVFTRGCRWTLGEAFGQSGVPGCKVDVDSLSFFSVAVSSVTDRTTFTATALPDTLGDDYFNFGRVVFLNEANQGLERKVLDYTSSSRTFVLQLPAAFALTTSHVVNLIVGCDQTWSTCDGRFSNTINYGGFRDQPGTDSALETPQ